MIRLEEAQSILNKFYGINGTLSKLPGDVDINFKVKIEAASKYVLKISRVGATLENAEVESQMIDHLVTNNCPLQLPNVVPSLDGTKVVELEDGRFVRLLSWVDGRLLADINPRTSELRHEWGRALGLVSKALVGYDHPSLHRDFRWDPAMTLMSRDRLKYLSTEEEKEIASYFWNVFEKDALPTLATLRKSVNYSDGHEMNLLCDEAIEGKIITGLIDFGDATYSYTICELAIVLAYACMDTAEPIVAAMETIRGYHEVFALTEEELSVLYYLVAGRLLITVTNAAWGRHQNPDNQYLQVSEKQAWDLLKKWRAVHPRMVHYAFRSACGWAACPTQLQFQDWIENQKPAFEEIIQSEGQAMPIDLSVGSPVFGNFENYTEKKKFSALIRRYLEDHDCESIYGGYGETRPIYTSDAFRNYTENGPRWRTVHCGFDIWIVAGTPVYAPYAATVHSLGYNNAKGDYGGCVILEHLAEGFKFYTLYGHLSKATIDQLSVGQAISASEEFATIGSEDENGHWPPHLHVQLILDMFDEQGDFPGVSLPRLKEVYLSICPNPTLLMSDKFKKRLPEKMSGPIIVQQRQKLMGKSLSLSYDKPLHIVRGQMQYLQDIDGRKYVDTCNNVAHVGHEHPDVVRVMQSQSAVLNTNTRYLHQNIVKYADELLATLPAELSVVYFVNSGSEANELALRMARNFRDRKQMIALEVGYHGNTGATVDVSSYKFDGKGGNGAPETTTVVPIPDNYRGIYRSKGMAEGTGESYAAHVRQGIEAMRERGVEPAGFISESIMSCGGQVVLPEGYLKSAFESVRAAGGVCISDEVQVGFGRVGKHFWGFELHGVVPDIVTMGKPIGNGYPLGAVAVSREIAESFSNGMEFFSTYGGNPVACAVGSAVLKVIQEEKLQQQAWEVGQFLIEGLQGFSNKYPIIGDVRGSGFFLGVELVRNRETLDPASAETSYIVNRMKALGFLMSQDGPHHNVIKIKPPMCFNHNNAVELLRELDKVLNEDSCRI